MASSRLAFTLFVLWSALATACGGSDGDGDGSGGSGNGNLSSGSICEQACDKLEQCSPGSTCTVNGSGACDGKAAEISQCIVDKPCGETDVCVLGGM
ncbi:MAG: hypothetical protein IPI67_30600 [Myxococcales bacterium]|nr:hypothetical protein [Myxococcales bacterium]